MAHDVFISYSSTGGPASPATNIAPVPGGKRFVISYADFHEADVKGKDPPGLLGAFAKGYRKGATLIGRKEVAIGLDKIPALTYQLELPGKLFIRERLALSGRRLYIQFIAAQDGQDFLSSAEADQFFEALEITKLSSLCMDRRRKTTGGLNPSAIGTALQAQPGMGRQRGVLSQMQESSTKQSLLPTLQTGP